MTVLTPTGAAAQRWNASRQRREKRVPLDRFLFCHALTLAPPGPARLTDDLATVAIYFVERAMQAHEQHLGFAPLHHTSVGSLTCAVTLGVARLIGEETSWYVASLVGVGVILAPLQGLAQSATLASSIAADYRDALSRGNDFSEISDCAATAIGSNDENLVTRCVLQIMDVLRLPQAQCPKAHQDAAHG